MVKTISYSFVQVVFILFSLVRKLSIKLFKKLVGIEALEKRHKQELAEQREAILAAVHGDNFEAVEAKIIVPEDVEDVLFESIRKLYGKDEAFCLEVMDKLKGEYIRIFDLPSYAYNMVTMGKDAATEKLIKEYANKLIKEKIAALSTYDLEVYFAKVAYLNSLYCTDDKVELKVETVAPSKTKDKKTFKQKFGLDPCEVNEVISSVGLDPAKIDRKYIEGLLNKISNDIEKIGYVGQTNKQRK